MKVQVLKHTRLLHIQKYGLAENESNSKGSDIFISPSPSLRSGDLVHADDIELSVTTGSSIASNVDMSSDTSGEDLFNYRTFVEMTLPEIYKQNFLDLTWKICCNISDNTYNQMKYNRDDDFWSLKVCKK